MQMTEVTFPDARPVEGYGPGFFRIAGEVLTGPVCVTARDARIWGGYDDAAMLLALEVDVILIGTGAETAHIPPGLRNAIEDADMGAEIMATPAACRTYNVLVSEGRRVALAALPV